MIDYNKRADRILSRINELATYTEDKNGLTRTFGSDAFIGASKKVKLWMQQAGLASYLDNIGNVRGKLLSANPSAKTLIIASHIDTVINAGRFDGPLGVLIGLDLLENVVQHKIALPFHIELIAFCDEEGVRFHTTYLGSKVVAGSFDETLLSKCDKASVTVAEVINNLGGDPAKLAGDSLLKDDLLGYFEIHIEQGPVLYERNIPVAIVTNIAGQKRVEITFKGMAGHAGTVPMNMRNDALVCAAQCVTVIEKYALANPIVATVGKLDILNAASNVIPGEVNLSVDIRSADEEILNSASFEINNLCGEISSKRNIIFSWKTIQETKSVACNIEITKVLQQSISEAGYPIIKLVSGAGHDAVPFSEVCPVSMMFVRCYKGISHNPAEDVEIEDIAAAIKVSDNLIINLIKKYSE